VHEGLENKLLLMKMLEFTQLKFVLLPSDIVATSPSQIRFPNAFDRLMDSRLQLPVQKREDTRNILLYNHIIQLLQNKNVGWFGGDHLTYGTRVERLTKAIWYIDPHLEKLHSRGCHLPSLFNSLPVYQQNSVYNEYYQRMKKKKPQLTRLELFHLANSIELSLAEPWATKASWQEVISNIFEFTSMMKKYSDHLETTNNNMKCIHESENPAREPSSNCNIRLISKHVGEIDERYSGPDSDLKDKELFEFVDLNQYVPNNPIKKHNFIRDIQLSVPAGLYR
jgi:hypothetical protein